jgi:hypothetical protein
MHINPAAAEATILSLCQSPQPYQACQFILGKLIICMFDICSTINVSWKLGVSMCLIEVEHTFLKSNVVNWEKNY